MRKVLLQSAAAVAVMSVSSALQAQTARPVRVQPLATERLAVVVPQAVQPSDRLQIAPVVAAPAIPNTLLVQSANPLSSIQALPVERQLSLSEIQSTRSLKLGSSTIDLSAMLENRDALPNIARRLQASPGAVSVKAVDVNAYVVPQGVIVRSFLNYQIKPGACGDAARRRQIEQAGVSCARKLSESQKVADYSNPRSARYVEDPAKRAEAIARARQDWAKQDAETATQVANFRAILANPTEREKVAAEIGAAETSRLEALGDDALAGELISSAETKIEDVMFIPKEDEVDKGYRAIGADYRAKLAAAAAELNLPVVENQPINKVVFLTGFTLGRQYEWSKRIEKTIKWCWVGCAVTYYAGARAGFSYGFGLRFPIVLDGTYRSVTDSTSQKGFLTATMTPVDGTPAQYSAAGLSSSQIFNGQEFVAELKASAGYDYKLPLIGEDHRTISVGYDLADKLPAPYTHGQFTPPAPGTTSGEIPFVFDQIDLLMGYGNWGAAGVLVHPAVKVGLHSDALRMTVHDNVSGTDQELVNGKRLPLAIDSTGKSSFWIGSPVYNLGFIVTPGVNAHAFIDVGVWSDSWDFPVWFPDIAITLPPGGVDFACHSGTICRRDYAYTASSRPDISGAAVTEGLEVMGGGTSVPKPPSPIIREGLVGRLQNAGTVQADDNSEVAAGTVETAGTAVVAACPEGLVPRRATAKDSKCVSRDERQKIVAENRAAKSNWDAAGANGPKTCVSGLVWRQAVSNDKVCVTPQRRDEVARMNSSG